MRDGRSGRGLCGAKGIPVCPHCGYDQSGEISTWEGRSPLDGVCVECGHAFAWREVYRILGEWESEVPWYAEHAHSLRAMLWLTPGTLAHLCFPSWFFASLNHRRRIRPAMLAVWLVVATVLLHAAISPIGYAAHRAEGYALAARGAAGEFDLVLRLLSDIANVFLYPFGFVEADAGGVQLGAGPFGGYEWAYYMLPTFALGGVIMFWSMLMVLVMLVRREPADGTRRETRQLMRVVLLSVLPLVVHVQIVRLGFGIHAATGMTTATNWVPVALIASALAMLCWQQLIWTHAVRTLWRMEGTLAINVGGCFGSIFFGFALLNWLL